MNTPGTHFHYYTKQGKRKRGTFGTPQQRKKCQAAGHRTNHKDGSVTYHWRRRAYDETTSGWRHVCTKCGACAR